MYIDTQVLEDEQIEVDTVIELYNSLINILGNNGALTPSHSENKNQIALYFYGEREYKYLLNKITPFLKDNIVGKKSSVVQIA